MFNISKQQDSEHISPVATENSPVNTALKVVTKPIKTAVAPPLNEADPLDALL